MTESEKATIAEIMLLADGNHKRLMSALKFDHLTSKENAANSIALILVLFREMTWRCHGNRANREDTEEEGATIERKCFKDLLEYVFMSSKKGPLIGRS